MRTHLTVIVAAILMAAAACDHPSGNSNGPVNRSGSVSTNASANRSALIEPTPPPEIKPAGPVDPNFRSCNLYYPLVPGSQAKYSVTFSSGLLGSCNVVVDRTEQDGKTVYVQTTQLVDNRGGFNKNETTVRKYVCDNGKVQILSEVTDNNVEENHNHVEWKLKEPAIAMVEPSALKTGTSWSYSFTQTFQLPGQPPVAANQAITIDFDVRGQESVTVPAGTFKVLKVVRKINQRLISDYFARGVGLVKREAEDGTRWELTELIGLKAEG